MPKIPNAIVSVAAVYADCPVCHQGYDGSEDGSMLLSMHNFKPEQVGHVVTCIACGTEYRLPASIRRIFR